MLKVSQCVGMGLTMALRYELSGAMHETVCRMAPINVMPSDRSRGVGQAAHSSSRQRGSDALGAPTPGY